MGDGPRDPRGLGSPDPAEEHDREVEFHLDMRSRDYEARGLDPDEARRRARERLGDLDGVRRKVEREARRTRGVRSGLGLLHGIGMDLRLALRRLRSSPTFTTVAVLTLALAVGVTGAVFALVDSVFLRELPYRDAHELVALWQTHEDGSGISTVAPANYLDWREAASTIETMAAFNRWSAVLTEGGQADRVTGSVVTPDFFDVLGVTPALGPGFRPDEMTAATDSGPPTRVAVLSHGLWTDRFGGDPGLVGRTIEINDGAYEVVGVMPPDFRYPASFLSLTPARLWVPIGFGPSATRRDFSFLHVVGRRAQGASLEATRAEMGAIGDRLAAAYPEANEGVGVSVRPVDEQMFGSQRPVLLTLLGAAGLVLLVASLNMANLFLARGLARGREFAVRKALGSGRGRIVRQLVVEAGLVALAGGAVGSVTLLLGSGVLRRAAAPYVGSLASPTLDWRVVAFTLAVAGGSGLLFGILPALRLSRTELATELRDRQTARGGRGARNALVAAEAALTVVLVFGAGLLGRSLVRLLSVPPGFAVERTLLFEVRPPASSYEGTDEILAFYDRLRTTLEGSPEIERIGYLSDIPLTSENWGTTFTLPLSDAPTEERSAEYHIIDPGYLDAAGVALKAGRNFTSTDGPDAPWVALVNEAAARRFWGSSDPVGEPLMGTINDVPIEVVGVVESTVDDGLDAPLEPTIYYPMAQSGRRSMWIVARTRGPAREALDRIRPLVASVDERVPVADLTTMRRHIDLSVAQPRGAAGVTMVFGGLALLMVAVGVYGVLSHAVTERTRELGIRAALGARREELVKLVLRSSLTVVGVGVATGLLLAPVVGRTLSSQLFGVPAWDPVTLGATILTVLAAALAAAWLPARRASRVDPLVAIRVE